MAKLQATLWHGPEGREILLLAIQPTSERDLPMLLDALKSKLDDDLQKDVIIFVGELLNAQEGITIKGQPLESYFEGLTLGVDGANG